MNALSAGNGTITLFFILYSCVHYWFHISSVSVDSCGCLLVNINRKLGFRCKVQYSISVLNRSACHFFSLQQLVFITGRMAS